MHLLFRFDDPGVDQIMDDMLDDAIRGSDILSLLRRLLFLPEQASTFAPSVDHLHYFVIAVTMHASFATGLVAVAFLFKYREREADTSTPLVNRVLDITCVGSLFAANPE